MLLGEGLRDAPAAALLQAVLFSARAPEPCTERHCSFLLGVLCPLRQSPRV